MKYAITVIVLILAFTLFAETIEHTIHFTSPELKNHRGETLIEFENTMQSGLPGEPSLPYRAIRLLLPPQETVSKISVYREDPIDLEGSWAVFPMQHVRPISEAGHSAYIRDNDVYSSSSAYPSRFRSDVRVDSWRGYSFASLTVTPVEYTPAEGSIRYYRTIRVSIETRADTRTGRLPVSVSEHSRMEARKIAENPQMAYRYNLNDLRTDTYEMLIVTSDDYMDDFGQLTELYRKRGIRCEIVSIDEATGSQMGQDDQEKLRNYIIQEYTNHDIQYVLLGGDVDIIQYRGFFCQVQSSDLVESDDIPSDLYYSALDGTWNDDNDDLWGEIGEDDLLPDVAVGRMPFDEQDEFNAMMNKILMYQTEPVESELNRPLLVGENMYNDPLTWGGDILDTIIGECDLNGYHTYGIPDDSPYETLYDRDQGQWSSSRLINEINDGHPYIHHAGHSNYNYNMRLTTLQITNNNFSNVNGTDHNYTNIYSHGCISAAFDEEDCIGERMVLIDNLAASYVGNTRFGWFNEGQLEGPSQHLHREYVDALYHGGIREIGRAHMESRIMSAPFVNAPGQHEQGALRWCFYDCTVLGDPAMSIWCDAPRAITATYDEPLPIGATSMQVSISADDGNVVGVVCSVVQDGVLLGTATTNAGGSAAILFDSSIVQTDDLFLYISGNDILTQSEQLSVEQVMGSWIVVQAVTPHETGNDAIDYQEAVSLDVSIKNIGQSASGILSASLATEDAYVDLSQSSAVFPALNPGDSTIVENAFTIRSMNGVPDQHSALIDIVFEEHEAWTSPFTLTFAAPQLTVDYWEIIYLTRDGYGILFPGETGYFNVTIANRGHATSPETTVSLTLLSGQATIEEQETEIDSIGSGEFDTAYFIITPSMEMDPGSIASFRMEVDSGDYSFEYILDIPVGELYECFEDFSLLPWAFTGDAEWQISDGGYAGETCARSGEIGNNDSSGLTIAMQDLHEGLISFYFKVSSEADCDKLRFFIDDTQMGMWSGDIDWRQKVCPVMAGDHTFTWLYTKDGGAVDGEDCAWVDLIHFPPHESPSSTDPEEVAWLVSLGLTNYPNPFNPETTFAFALENPSRVSLDIYNIRGQRVRTLTDERMESGIHRVTWHGRDDNNRSVGSGVYFARIVTEAGAVVKKMVLIK